MGTPQPEAREHGLLRELGPLQGVVELGTETLLRVAATGARTVLGRAGTGEHGRRGACIPLTHLFPEIAQRGLLPSNRSTPESRRAASRLSE